MVGQVTKVIGYSRCPVIDRCSMFQHRESGKTRYFAACHASLAVHCTNVPHSRVSSSHLPISGRKFLGTPCVEARLRADGGAGRSNTASSWRFLSFFPMLFRTSDMNSTEVLPRVLMLAQLSGGSSARGKKRYLDSRPWKGGPCLKSRSKLFEAGRP